MSRFQVGLSSIAYCAGLISIWLSDLPSLLQISLSLMVLSASMVHGFRLFGAYSDRVRQIVYTDSWWLFLQDRRVRKVELVGESVVLPWVVSMTFSDGQKRYPVAIFSDSVTATEHRQLRAKLLMSEVKPAFWRLAVTRWYQNGIRRIRRG